MSAYFHDRLSAGVELGRALSRHPRFAHPTPDKLRLIAVSDGGMRVAAGVCWHLPIDVEIAPVAPVFAPLDKDVLIGMLVDDGTLYVDDELATEFGARGSTLDHLVDRADDQLRSTMRSIGDEPGAVVAGLDVLVVDDYIDAGITAQAVCDWLRRWGAAHVTLAVAASSPDGLARAANAADEVITLTKTTADERPADRFLSAEVDPEPAAMRRLFAAIGVGRESHAQTRLSRNSRAR